MGDGHLNKCKECSKSDNVVNRTIKRDYYLAYDKSRAKEPHRALARTQYRATEAGSNAVKKAHKNYRINYPKKQEATNAVRNAIQRGALVRPSICSSCLANAKVEAHHDDYAKHLDIRWLCKKCHTDWHLNNKPLNGE